MALLCRSGMIVDQTRHAGAVVLATQLAVLSTTFAGIAVAVAEQSLVLLAGAAAIGQAAGHLVQIGGWHRAGLLHTRTALRMHAIHAVIGAGLGGAAALGARAAPGRRTRLRPRLHAAGRRALRPPAPPDSAVRGGRRDGAAAFPRAGHAGPEPLRAGVRFAAAARDDVKGS